MLHHFFQDYNKIQGSFNFYKVELQDCNHQSYYYTQDVLYFLDNELDKDESENESDDEDEKSDRNIRDS